MFELAEQARKEFAAADPKLLALMGRMDDARVTKSRKASQGCTAETWQAFTGVVSAIGAKPFAALKSDDNWSFVRTAVSALIGTPNGYLAALALNQCGGFENDTN